jgi:flagellar export protein FliJ
MKTFCFRLQAVLTLREQAEQAAQQECARAYAALERAGDRLRSLDGLIPSADELRRNELSSGARADRLEQLRAYAVNLQERRTQLARELADARRLVETAWRQLIVATQNREALDRLGVRQRRAHDYNAARVEQKLLDEFSNRPKSEIRNLKSEMASSRQPTQTI